MQLDKADSQKVLNTIRQAIADGKVVDTFDFTRDELQVLREWTEYLERLVNGRYNPMGIQLTFGIRSKLMKNLFPDKIAPGSSEILSVLKPWFDGIDSNLKIDLTLNQGNAKYSLVSAKYALVPWLEGAGLTKKHIDKLFKAKLPIAC